MNEVIEKIEEETGLKQVNINLRRQCAKAMEELVFQGSDNTGKIQRCSGFYDSNKKEFKLFYCEKGI